jgi:hypothetical protein
MSNLLDFLKKHNVEINATEENRKAGDKIFVKISEEGFHYYAIPTAQIGENTVYVNDFIDFAEERPDLIFYVEGSVEGFSDDEIAPLFKGALKLNNVLLPQSFVPGLSAYQIPENYKIREYGYARTLVDIIKVLNDKEHYTSPDTLYADFIKVLEQYSQRGTFTAESRMLIHSVIEQHEHELFSEGKLNIVRLKNLFNDKDCVYKNIEKVFHKRSIAKLIKLVRFFNNDRKYTSSQQILDDFDILFNHRDSYGRSVLNDPSTRSFGKGAPYYAFLKSLRDLWDKLVRDGQLDNDLLENVFFEQHDEKVRKFGLSSVLETDYKEEDAPCPNGVRYPVEGGPVYLPDGIKPCGVGLRRGSRTDPYFYERRLLNIIKGNRD